MRSRRLMNLYMARDYVTLRKEVVDGEEVWTENSVGRSLLKSSPARVVHSDGAYRIEGRPGAKPIAKVEVQIDDGPWQEATLDMESVRRFAWRFWSLDWPNAEPGEHSITARAVDTEDNIQPPADDPMLVNKITYWESNGQITRRVAIPE
ncbi:MAG: hypothetical protein R2867_26770 [Caldilineaceae bacterium]